MQSTGAKREFNVYQVAKMNAEHVPGGVSSALPKIATQSDFAQGLPSEIAGLNRPAREW